MPYRFLIVLLLVSLSACSFQMQVLTPDPSVTITAPTPTTFSSTELLSATPSPLPTFTPTVASGNLSIHPIRFSPNGTYIDVADGIPAGSRKTYSVNALKGQVMSVSILQSLEGDWVYIPMEIVGADGSTLCPPIVNTECTFWRGILPSTQEYLITLTPVNAVNFTLRVAINPPGVATQSFQYLSQGGKASFSYTDEFAPVRFPGAEVYKIDPELTMDFIDTKFYLNTNLLEAFLLFGSSSAGEMLQNCTQPISFGGPESIVGEETVNGVKFVHSQGGGVSAGNIYEQTYYRAAYQGVCYEVTFFVHYGNIGAYSPDVGVKEFDHEELLQKFEGILSTLIIK